MKLTNLNWIFVIILMVTAINFFSCNKDDNPIKPNPPSELIVDSNFFDWKIDTIGGTLGGLDIYVADTNKIFTIGNVFGIYINSGVVTKINYLSSEQYFQATCVNGTNENNVYFGGCKSIPNGKTYPRLKRWNGSSIINIPLPDDTCSITKIVVISDNNLWMTTDHNIIYHYDNSQTTTYKVDSCLTGGFICRDDFGNLYAPFGKMLTSANSVFYVYKYQNDKLYKVYEDTVYFQSELRTNCRSIGNNLVRQGLTGYYNFINNSWIKILNTGTSLNGREVGGNDFNNVLFHGEEVGVGLMLYYFNGNQIYRQNNFHFIGEMIYHIQFKFGRFYFGTNDFGNWETYLGIGTFKKQNLKPLNPKINEKNNFYISIKHINI